MRLARHRIAGLMAYSNPLLKALLYEETPEAAELLGHGNAFIVIVPPLETKDELMVDSDFLGMWCMKDCDEQTWQSSTADLIEPFENTSIPYNPCPIGCIFNELTALTPYVFTYSYSFNVHVITYHLPKA
jgi:hypothetical protein